MDSPDNDPSFAYISPEIKMQSQGIVSLSLISITSPTTSYVLSIIFPSGQSIKKAGKIKID